MANKAPARSAVHKASERAPKGTGKATGKSRPSTASNGSPTSAKVVRLTRAAASAIRDESAALKKGARGTLKDVSRRVHHLTDEAEELGSGAAKAAVHIGRTVGEFASDHRYSVMLGAISLGLVVTARQLSTGEKKRVAPPTEASAPHLQSSVARSVSAVAASAHEGAQAAFHQVEQGYERVEHAVQGSFSAHPLLIGGAVVAAGLAIGFALPASERETVLLEDVGRSLAKQGKRSLADVVGQTEHAVQAATNVAKFAAAAFRSVT